MMVEWIVSSSILITVVITLRFVLKGKMSLRLQYALWALVLLRLLVPVSFGSTGMSVLNAVPESIPSSVFSIGMPEGAYTLPEGESAPQAAPADPAGNVAPDNQDVGSVANEYSRVTDWGLIAKAVWLSGITLVGLWLFLSNLRLASRLKKTRKPLEIAGYRLPVYLSDAVDTPCLFGLFRPAIYVTSEAAEEEMKLLHIVEHETTHFRHGDHVWSLLRGVCLALHWYNPLVWWAAILSRNDAELACDEGTINRIGEDERAEYGRTLIGMTCQKRPALLLTATTMTGSGNSIKERIKLIAIKPKTAIYALVAVLLIAAVAVGCTFTGAKRTEGPWNWSQELSSENVTGVVPWAAVPGSSESDLPKLSGEETDTLVRLLNSLKRGDFTENSGLTGETPNYGLRIQTSAGTYHLNESIAPAGALEMSYNDKQWWISNDGLADFVTAHTAEASVDVKLSVEVGADIPAAVVDYAKDTVSQRISAYHEGWPEITDPSDPCRITAAKITGLTQVNTGTAGLTSGRQLWLLEYRLLVEGNIESILVGGMSEEDGWLTEWSSLGQPYLLLHYHDSGSETVWQRVCITSTEEIYGDYGTPEMLEQYGNAYTAATTELYKKYQGRESGEVASPATAVNSLFDNAGSVELTLYLANDGAYNSYSAGQWYAGRFEVLLSGYEWTELEMPSTDPSDFWLTAASSDGKQSMTFWSNSGAGIVQYNSETGSTYWSAKPVDGYSVSIAEDVRGEYDNLDVSCERISFSLSGSAMVAAEHFAHNAYGSHMMNLAPGNMYGVSAYEVVDWGVLDVSDDDSAVVGRFRCAVIPWDMDSPGIWAGNTSMGTGEFEGWVTYSREFVLQKQEDGYWYCIGLGTGGYTLPEGIPITEASQADLNAPNPKALIISALNSDGAYATMALDALLDSLMDIPAETFEAIGARYPAIQEWICWFLAAHMDGMALDTSDALSVEGLSEAGQSARDTLWKYMWETHDAPPSWRQVYRDFWENELPEILDAIEIDGVGLIDFDSDGVPELAVLQADGTSVIYYTDGEKVYHNLGNVYDTSELDFSGSILSISAGDVLDGKRVNALLNAWRPVS